MIVRTPPPPDDDVRFRVRLEATPALIGRLLALTPEARRHEHERLRGAGMLVLRRYLPPDLIGSRGSAHTIERRPVEVMTLYQRAVELSRAELGELGLILDVRGGLWR